MKLRGSGQRKHCRKRRSNHSRFMYRERKAPNNSAMKEAAQAQNLTILAKVCISDISNINIASRKRSFCDSFQHLSKQNKQARVGSRALKIFKEIFNKPNRQKIAGCRIDARNQAQVAFRPVCVCRRGIGQGQCRLCAGL